MGAAPHELAAELVVRGMKAVGVCHSDASDALCDGTVAVGVVLRQVAAIPRCPAAVDQFLSHAGWVTGDCGLTLQDMLPTIMCIDLIMR